ncbi:kelch-like protein 10 [Ptychodera flava]|uniref:kelch-like protein 10 n=1 Tax=Ptychodera flava TaxID=63121 RepID=UPI003969EBBE
MRELVLYQRSKRSPKPTFIAQTKDCSQCTSHRGVHINLDELKSHGREYNSMEKKISVAACNVFRELRQNRQLCDVVISADDQEFPAHRNILSACSPYFRALFTNGMYESLIPLVKIPGVSARIMNQIIDYAYTRDVIITEDNVVDLVVAADQFHILGILDQCVDFLVARLSPDNCIGIRKFAQCYYIPALAEAAFKYTLEHFDEVSSNYDKDEFLELSIDELVELVSHDDLNVKVEEIAFEAVIRWIDYDPENRRLFLFTLLSSIRLGIINPEYFISKVKCHAYIRDNEECKPLIIETMKYLYDLSGHDVDFQNPISRPRVPQDVLFAVGGWSGGNPTNVVEAYDTRADRWKIVEPSDTSPRAYHGVAVLDRMVYIIGGFDGNEYFNSCRCFDPVGKVWREIAPMNTRRCYVSVAVCRGRVYAMGGFDGHTRTKTAERYQPETNQWSLLNHMNHHRSDACATFLEDRIYICGGFNGHECLQTAENYDPDTGLWTDIPPMRNRRSGVGVAGYRGCVYAVGGFNGLSRLNTAERYSPVTNQWQTIPTMYVHRSNFGITVLDDMLFVIGGFNGVTTIFNVECFDEKAGEWYDAADMSVFRSALSCGVVKGLPNRRDYTWPRDPEKPETVASPRAARGNAASASTGQAEDFVHDIIAAAANELNENNNNLQELLEEEIEQGAEDDEETTSADEEVPVPDRAPNERRPPSRNHSNDDQLGNNGFALMHLV